MSALANTLSMIGMGGKSGGAAPRLDHWWVALNADTTIATGGQDSSAQTRIDADADFAVDRIAATVRIPAASGASISQTPLSRNSTNTVASNTFAALDMIRVEFFQDGQTRTIGGPMPVTSVCGTGTNCERLMVPWVLPAGSVISATIYNDSAESIRARFLFIGAKIRR